MAVRLLAMQKAAGSNPVYPSRQTGSDRLSFQAQASQVRLLPSPSVGKWSSGKTPAL